MKKLERYERYDKKDYASNNAVLRLLEERPKSTKPT
jgi:hypothetical protein